MLTEKAIAGIKAYIDRTIVYARYKIGGTYYKTRIDRREYLKDGRVAVYFSIGCDHYGGSAVRHQ